ncbi:ArsR/SmtB family transcription factor [Paludisphaera soli]|uniref:ArsR/SmtB family transcription factor n=1 Tax=Paludisphaera soli TaxID=2712865 RepID=UPI0013EA7759|nr:metalloregulator ArsR/SmtB family transcription factor [Paludisphaera soli]
MDETCCSPSTLRKPSSLSIEEARASDAELANLAKALGHPARVQIVRFLLARDSCMCGDIVEHLPLAQSTVSQHLKTLKESGLVRGDIDGPRVCYCVEPKALDRLKRLVAGL